jgi:hypothetical protein
MAGCGNTRQGIRQRDMVCPGLASQDSARLGSATQRKDHIVNVQLLEEYKAHDGRFYKIGELANLPEGEARVLIRTGRAREATFPEDKPKDPSSSS